MNSTFYLYLSIQIGWVILGLRWYLKRSDEIPVLIAGLALYSTGYRYWAVVKGLTHWVSLPVSAYAPITSDRALEALGWIVLGQSIMLAVYIRKQNTSFPLFRGLLSWEISSSLWKWLVFGAILYVPATIWAKYYIATQFASGKSLAFESSAYIYQIPFVGVGLVVMLALLWKFGNLHAGFRLTTMLIAIVILTSLYGVTDRFKLIGALIGSGIILGANVPTFRRIMLLGPIFAAAIALFSLGGSERDTLREYGAHLSASERFKNAHDANFIDGFVISMQNVKRFGYRYGGGHLEILYRPIPRFLWPGKPVGNFQLRALGLDSGTKNITVGISPSIYGSFYEEGGGIGVVLGSLLYGLGLAWLVRRIRKFNPGFAALLRGVLCGWLVSLFRGGDVAGVVAWAFMSFWPLALFFFIWRHKISVGADWVKHSAKSRSGLRSRQVRMIGDPGDSLAEP